MADEDVPTPTSRTECAKTMHVDHTKWPIIDREFRDQRFWKENALECVAYASDPVGYMAKFEDGTPFTPEAWEDCEDRHKLRRMDFSKGIIY